MTMLVANTTPGTVYLSHGTDRAVRTVRFRPRGDKDSVQELVDSEWSGSRNLNRLLRADILYAEGAIPEDLPAAPSGYSALNRWDRMRVRTIVLGTDAEFAAEGLFTPMGNAPRMPQAVDTQYIKKRLLPAIGVAAEWLANLFDATGDKAYKNRLEALDKHAGALRELQLT